MNKKAISGLFYIAVKGFFCIFTGIFSWQVSVTLNYKAFAGVFDGLAAAEKGLKPLFFNYCAEKSRKQL